MKGANAGTPVVSNDGINFYPEGTIRISKDVADFYEKNYNSSDKVTAKAAEILLESTLFHESTHYGDAKKGGMDMTSMETEVKNGATTVVQGRTKEGGKDFEKAAYGRDIGNGATFAAVIADAKAYVAEKGLAGTYNYTWAPSNATSPTSGHLNSGTYTVTIPEGGAAVPVQK